MVDAASRARAAHHDSLNVVVLLPKRTSAKIEGRHDSSTSSVSLCLYLCSSFQVTILEVFQFVVINLYRVGCRTTLRGVKVPQLVFVERTTNFAPKLN